MCPPVLCLILDSPEPWLNQLYVRRSCLAAPTLLGTDATVNTGRWLSFSPSLWPVLVFLVPREEQVQCCHHVSYTNNTLYSWYKYGMLVKLFIAVLVLYMKCCASARGAPYIGWARTCMGLTVALGMRQARPCYWSQTCLSIEISPFGKNFHNPQF